MSDALFSKKHEDILPRDILDSSPGAIIVVEGGSLRLRYCNRQFENTFNGNGVDIESFNELISPSDELRLNKQFDLAKTHPETQGRYGVYSVKASGGNKSTFYIFASPVKDQDNLYQLFLLPDLSKRHVPFISFDTRELFMQQFNDSNFGTFEWTISDDKVFFSDKIYSILEIDRGKEEPTPGSLAKYIQNGETERILSHIQRLLEQGGKEQIVLKLTSAKNNVRMVDVVAEVMADADKKPYKLIGTVKEITEQYRIEEDLKRNVKELNRSNKELEEFAYVASHDLQEPLRKISTFSDRLAEKYKEQIEGEGKMYLQRIIASAAGMRTLIDNLLDFSRLSRSTQPYTEINLGFVLREVKTELELVIEETSTTVNSDALPVIEAVHSQMKQLFTNILGNAIKFRKQGEAPVIEIKCSVPDEGELSEMHLPRNGAEYYKLQFTDNGIGFEEEFAEKIFQIFQRLNAKSEYPGSGIGLAICKKIAENHQGVIYAENLAGQGARFTVILPAKQQKQ